MKKIIHITFSSLLLLSTTLLAGACGEDDGISDGRKVASLSADDVVALCEESAYSPQAEAGLVTFGCILELTGADTCTAETLATCIAEADAPAQDECTEPTAEELDLMATCDATVGEVRACLEATSATFEGLADATCATEIDVSTEPAACASLRAACPEWYGHDDV